MSGRSPRWHRSFVSFVLTIRYTEVAINPLHTGLQKAYPTQGEVVPHCFDQNYHSGCQKDHRNGLDHFLVAFVRQNHPLVLLPPLLRALEKRGFKGLNRICLFYKLPSCRILRHNTARVRKQDQARKRTIGIPMFSRTRRLEWKEVITLCIS